MNGDRPDQTSSNSPSRLKWRVRLSDKAPSKTFGIIAVAIAAFLIGALLFKNITLGLIGFAIIFGSTAEFWLGSLFTIDEKGASVRTGLSYSVLEWANVKRILRDKDGIKLSPLERPGSMDTFRGVYLRFGEQNEESIERAILAFGKFSSIDVVNGTDRRGDRGAGSEGSQ